MPVNIPFSQADPRQGGQGVAPARGYGGVGQHGLHTPNLPFPGNPPSVRGGGGGASSNLAANALSVFRAAEQRRQFEKSHALDERRLQAFEAESGMRQKKAQLEYDALIDQQKDQAKFEADWSSFSSNPKYFNDDFGFNEEGMKAASEFARQGPFHAQAISDSLLIQEGLRKLDAANRDEAAELFDGALTMLGENAVAVLAMRDQGASPDDIRGMLQENQVYAGEIGKRQGMEEWHDLYSQMSSALFANFEQPGYVESVLARSEHTKGIMESYQKGLAKAAEVDLKEAQTREADARTELLKDERVTTQINGLKAARSALTSGGGQGGGLPSQQHLDMMMGSAATMAYYDWNRKNGPTPFTPQQFAEIFTGSGKIWESPEILKVMNDDAVQRIAKDIDTPENRARIEGDFRKEFGRAPTANELTDMIEDEIFSRQIELDAKGLLPDGVRPEDVQIFAYDILDKDGSPLNLRDPEVLVAMRRIQEAGALRRKAILDDAAAPGPTPNAGAVAEIDRMLVGLLGIQGGEGAAQAPGYGPAPQAGGVSPQGAAQGQPQPGAPVQPGQPDAQGAGPLPITAGQNQPAQGPVQGPAAPQPTIEGAIGAEVPPPPPPVGAGTDPVMKMVLDNPGLQGVAPPHQAQLEAAAPYWTDPSRVAPVDEQGPLHLRGQPPAPAPPAPEPFSPITFGQQTQHQPPGTRPVSDLGGAAGAGPAAPAGQRAGTRPVTGLASRQNVPPPAQGDAAPAPPAVPGEPPAAPAPPPPSEAEAARGKSKVLLREAHEKGYTLPREHRDAVREGRAKIIKKRRNPRTTPGRTEHQYLIEYGDGRLFPLQRSPVDRNAPAS